MKKKVFSILLVFAMAVAILTVLPVQMDVTDGLLWAAPSEITVVIDGKNLSFDVPPQNVNGRILVPLRAIFEEMGAAIEFDSNTSTVTARKDGTVVVLTIGSTSPMINGVAVTIDQPGIIVDGRTLAPLRFVAEAFGGNVEWNGESQMASIASGGESDSGSIGQNTADGQNSSVQVGGIISFGDIDWHVLDVQDWKALLLS